MDTLTWLHNHSHKTLTPTEWANLLGIRIIDADGWKRGEFDTPIGLLEFVKRVSRCTIM